MTTNFFGKATPQIFYSKPRKKQKMQNPEFQQSLYRRRTSMMNYVSDRLAKKDKDEEINFTEWDIPKSCIIAPQFWRNPNTTKWETKPQKLEEVLFKSPDGKSWFKRHQLPTLTLEQKEQWAQTHELYDVGGRYVTHEEWKKLVKYTCNHTIGVQKDRETKFDTRPGILKAVGYGLEEVDVHGENPTNPKYSLRLLMVRFILTINLIRYFYSLITS
eukprot:GHVP01009081.1.p1 GENE.GHVP01009081.1~~GHVP01009081.1.p1  ORF type:complete len:216 (+),score=22.18 GHVP01009081.1:268-915(+)